MNQNHWRRLFVTGILIARYPQLGFLIYGAGWFVVLQVLGVLFLLKRRNWLPLASTSPPLSAAPSTRSGSSGLVHSCSKGA